MRKIIVNEFISLDGVMQAPGGPEEDTEAAFTFGGWQAPFDDDLLGEVTQKELAAPLDYLFGRKTFDIFAGYWPKHKDVWPAVSTGMKYVLSNTLDKTDWENTTFVKSVDDIKKLKETDGPDIQVWGSSKLVQLLLENDLVDEMRLMIYPLILGKGKRLFADGAVPRTLTLTDSKVGKSGVMVGLYKRGGEVKTGIMGE